MKGSDEIMSGPKTILSNGWSTLNTVDDFDLGLSNNSKEVIRANDDLSKTVVKSLFIESLIDQLCKLLEKDPIKRHKLYEGICRKLYDMQLIEDTYNVEELASLRGHYQQALLDVMVTPDTRLYSTPCIKLGSSRYANEYEEICFLASGGFGKVFKARNKLDQMIYAIKKISLKYQNITTFARKLNEVKTLAKLNHPNIVQYKAAWLEPLFNSASPVQSTESNRSSTDSDIVLFKSDHSSSTSNYNILTQEENEKNLAVCKYQGESNLPRPSPQMSALLYVAMQLCDETLCEWLSNRNLHKEKIDVSLILNIMIQAASGVQYIHSCNIVHHDIKPRNIFISKDSQSIQVGDFGLSCCLQGHDHSDCPLEGGLFGTPLYAAPEQLKGHCDAKSDIFSLGLVFTELLTVFSTEMERAKVLTNARSGNLPASIPTVLVPIIKDLVSHKPNKRPTASQLIAMLQKLKPSELCECDDGVEVSNEIGTEASGVNKNESNGSTLERDQLIKDKEKEIIELKQILAQREHEIKELKYLINKTSS